MGSPLGAILVGIVAAMLWGLFAIDGLLARAAEPRGVAVVTSM